MSLDARTVLAILAMALATYACRGGGYWLFRQITPGPVLRAVLSYIPGTLFVSFVVPALVSGRPFGWVGAAVTVAVMARTRTLAWAILAGTAAAWVTWSLA